MSKLHGWLGAAVEHDLRLAALWNRIGIDQNGFLKDTTDLVRRESSLVEQAEEVRRRHDAGDFDPDEDRFSIARTTPNSEDGLVQLVRFLKKSAPVQAIISDGTTSTYVKFKAKSLQDYYKKCKRNFTDTRNGCLLRLQAFNIQAAMSESVHDQVSLLVLDFDSRGLPQPPIGQPVPLEEVAGVKEALHALFSVPSQLSTEAPVEEPFQAESLEAPPSPASVASQISHASVEQERFETQLPFGSSFVASPPAQHVKLLRFISKKPDLALHQDHPANISNISSPHATEVPPDPAGPLRPPAAAERLAPSHKIDSTQQSGDCARMAPGQIEKRDFAQAAATSAGEDTANNSSLQLDKGEGPPASPSEIEGLSAKRPIHPSLLEHNPWMGMKSPLPIIAVPKDQLAILGRPHSWYPAEPGKAFPVGNVPHTILQWAEEQVRQNKSANTAESPAEHMANDLCGKSTQNEQLTKSMTSDGGDDSDASDVTELSWSGSSGGDEEDEDDSKSSIDPSPTMPSPLKSPAAARDPLPPDSSLPSPESPHIPRRSVLHVDSDDEMEFAEPHAQSGSPSASVANISVRRTTIELGSSRTPTATIDAIPVTSLDGNMDSSLRSKISSLFTAKSQPSAPLASPGADRFSDRDGSGDDTDSSQHEGFVTPPEIALARQRSISSLSDDVLAESESELSSNKVPQTRDDGAAPSEAVPEPRLSSQPGLGNSNPPDQSSQSLSQARRRLAVPMQTGPPPPSTKISRSSLQPNRGESQDFEAKVHHTPPPLQAPITLVQSTYPERSAQKRKPARDESLSPRPKRVKQATKGFGFSQDTPVMEDYRKEGRLKKREFLRQYQARKEEALQDPEVSSTSSVSGDDSSDVEEDINATRSNAVPTAAAWNGGHTSQTSNKSSSVAQAKAEAGERMAAATPDTTLANRGAKRGLPWKQKQPPRGTRDASWGREQSPHSSTPPLLAGWRERARTALASSGRSSPQPAAVRSSEPHRAVSGSSFKIRRLSSAPSGRSGSRPGTHVAQVASSGTIAQLIHHVSGTAVPGARAKPATPAEMQTQHDHLSTSSLQRRLAGADDVTPEPTPRHQSPPAQRYMPSPGSHPLDRVSRIDGPVVDLHQDFQKLKAVQRDLGTTEAEVRKRHTKRWSVLDWKLS